MPIHANSSGGTKPKQATTKIPQDTFSNKKHHPICRNFNRFATSKCKRTDKMCSQSHLHKYIQCRKFGFQIIRYEPKHRASEKAITPQINNSTSAIQTNPISSPAQNSSVNTQISLCVTFIQQK